MLINFIIDMKRKRENESEQDPNKQQKLNYSNILSAIVNNNIEAVKFHIAKDPELVFHQFFLQDLKAGAEIKDEDEDEYEYEYEDNLWYPLHIAAENGYTEIVKVLIAAGAKIDAKHRLGMPLQCAICHGHTETIEVLIKAGAGIDTNKENFLYYGLGSSIYESNNTKISEVLTVLIKHGIEVSESEFQELRDRLTSDLVKSLKSLLIIQKIFNKEEKYQYSNEIIKELQEHIQSPTVPDCNEQDLVEYVDMFNAIFKRKLIEATKQHQVINKICNLINLVRDNIIKKSNLTSFIAEKIVESSNLSLFMSEGQYSDKSMFKVLSEKKYAAPLMTMILIKGALREIDLEEISKSSGELLNQDLVDKLSQFREILSFNNNKKIESAKKDDIEIRTTQEEVPNYMQLDDVTAAGSHISASDIVD